MSQKLLFVGIALFVLVTAVWGQTIQTPNQVFAAMNLGKSTAVNQAEFVKLSFDPPRLMEGSTTIYELNGFIQTRSLKNEDYTLVIQVDGVHVGIDGWNGLALNNGDKLDTHLFLPSPNASSVTVQAEIMYGPSKTLIARVQKQLALPVAPPATPPQSQPASDFVGPPAPVFIQPDGTSAKNMTVPLPPGFIPQTITATACPEPANPAIPPHCETAVQKGVPPTSVFDTQSNTWENIFSDQSLDTFARWAEQQAGVSDEGLPVKIVLSNPPKEPVERVVIIKPIAPLVFATTFSSSSPQNLGVSLVSLASKDPTPLTNTVNGQSRYNGSTNLTEYEKIVVVREGDYPIGVQWSWSKLGSDWWKQGDYYPRVYLNRPTNPLSMFDGSPVQLADVEQKIVAAKKDWLPISPRVDSSSSSFDQSPPALVPVVLPDTSKTDSTGSVQDTGKQSGNGWKGNDIPVQWLGLENVLVVEIRSHSQNDRVVAQGSLKFRLPPQFSSSGVVYDKETKSVDKPPQFQLPDDPADRALWISFLTAGKKDSQLRLCPPSTSATSKPCTTQSVALDAVKDNSGQTTAVEIPSSTLFSILDALGALNGTAGSDLVELVATNENGTPLIIGSMEVTTSCKTLLECLARVDKELVDSLMGAVPVGPKDVTPLESTPPATPVQPELVTKFEVYSTSWCDQCKPLIEYLNSKGFFESTDFMKYDVDKDAAKAVELRVLEKLKEGDPYGVPFTVIGDVQISGFDSQKIDATLKRYNIAPASSVPAPDSVPVAPASTLTLTLRDKDAKPLTSVPSSGIVSICYFLKSGEWKYPDYFEVVKFNGEEEFRGKVSTLLDAAFPAAKNTRIQNKGDCVQWPATSSGAAPKTTIAGWQGESHDTMFDTMVPTTITVEIHSSKNDSSPVASASAVLQPNGVVCKNGVCSLPKN